MFWADLLLRRRPSEEALRHALSVAFEIPETDIAIVPSLAEVLAPSPAIVELRSTRGDFESLATIVLNRSVAPPVLATAKRVAEMLGVEILVPSESENPYEFVVITRAGRTQLVLVRADALDERDEYRLVDA